jgi:hypothetical protein
VILDRNRDKIAAALESYHDDTGKYPERIEELVPVYITEIVQPKSIWGWLYSVDGDDFALGYVNYVDKLGYSVCFISSRNTDLNCMHEYLSPSPFDIAPTPIGTDTSTPVLHPPP